MNNCQECGAEVFKGDILCEDCEDIQNHRLKKLKASGAGQAATTRGRKTRFKDKRREASRKECRRRQEEDE